MKKWTNEQIHNWAPNKQIHKWANRPINKWTNDQMGITT